ncbi:MAG: 8-hydroxy-5-deazaflavin:NADPH oxidoreductase [Actinomycetota bacterium]|jgi:NADPH-dependent F420 reductase|nr:8-hydroxy-5-deazaflavin:NADPH oxidoreductase [Actinomycetota bacterium]
MTIEQVSIIGATGHEGFGLAARWARAGRKIVIGSRDEGRAQDAAGRLRALVSDAEVEGMENGNAAAAGSVVVVTVPFAAQAGIYRSIGEHLGPGAIVIDCTVPVAAAVGGAPSHVLGVWEGSAAQQAAAMLPKGTTLCAAFHSLSATALVDLDKELEGDVLTCGAKDGKETVRELVEAIPALRFVDAGPLSAARIVEPITALLIGINHRYKTDRAGIHITGI